VEWNGIHTFNRVFDFWQVKGLYNNKHSCVPSLSSSGSLAKMFFGSLVFDFVSLATEFALVICLLLFVCFRPKWEGFLIICSGSAIQFEKLDIFDSLLFLSVLSLKSI